MPSRFAPCSGFGSRVVVQSDWAQFITDRIYIAHLAADADRPGMRYPRRASGGGGGGCGLPRRRAAFPARSAHFDFTYGDDDNNNNDADERNLATPRSDLRARPVACGL